MRHIIETYLALLVIIIGLVSLGVGLNTCFIDQKTIHKVIVK